MSHFEISGQPVQRLPRHLDRVVDALAAAPSFTSKPFPRRSGDCLGDGLTGTHANWRASQSLTASLMVKAIVVSGRKAS
jgi:hypothetical protein